MQDHNNRPILSALPMPPQQISHQQQPLQPQPQQQQQQQQPPAPQQANQQAPTQPSPNIAGYGPPYYSPPIHNRYSNPISQQYAAYPHAHIPSPYMPPPFVTSHTGYQQPPWSTTQMTYPAQVAPAPLLNQSRTPSVNQPPKNQPKRMAKITDPITGKPVVLPDVNKSKRPTITSNATTPVYQAKDQPDSTTSSKVATIKPPPAATATGPATATSNKIATATSNLNASLQSTTAQANSPSTKTDSSEDATASNSKGKSSKATLSTSAKIVSDRPNTDDATLAVQNEFACKVSERLADENSVKTKSSQIDGTNTRGKPVVAVDPAKVEEKNVANKTDSTTELDESKKENRDSSTDKAEQIVNNEVDGDKTGDKVAESKSEGVEEDDKKTTSDGSNKEGKDGSEQSEEGALQYEYGQYNPKTKKGKRKYNKQFLMAIYEIINKEMMKTGLPDTPDYLSGGVVDFTPPWHQKSNFNHGTDPRSNDPLRRPNQQYYGGRSSDRQERQKKIIPTSSLGQDVELKTTANPWRPGPSREQENKAEDPESDIESLKKQFRSILNKLTPNNFDSLAEKVSVLNIDTEAKLGDVIDIVFAKALSEPGYSVLYGRMCSHLKKIAAGKAEFGSTLLKRCQNQFQTDIYSGLDVEGREKAIEEEQDPDKKKHLSEELYEDMYRCRMRGLGLIKFIGELYKIGMLNEHIMFTCITKLLYQTEISDESIECLCDLLSTIGEKLDLSCKEQEKNLKKQKSQGAPKANAYQGGQKSAAAIVAQGPAQPQVVANLDTIFENLHKIRKDNTNKLSLRIRFKILDICELREKENWQSKKTRDNDPKKLEEIREAHMEKLEMEKRRDAAMGPRRSQEGRRGGLGLSSGSSNQISSLANDQGGNRGTGGMHMSASSQSIRDHSNDSIRNQEDFAKTKSFATNILKGLGKSTSASSGASSGNTGLRPTMRKQ